MAASTQPEPALRNRALASALVVAACGLVYEMLAGTVASWALGDTVAQFGVVLGLYLGALGLGAWLSERLPDPPGRGFVLLEIGVGVAGALLVAGLFQAIGTPSVLRVVLYGGTVLVGTLVGAEAPLLLRIVAPATTFRDAAGWVLAYDHAGSLVGAMLYAFVLVRWLGPLRTGFLVAALNALVAFATAPVFVGSAGGTKGLRAAALVVLAACLAAAWLGESFILPVDPA